MASLPGCDCDCVFWLVVCLGDDVDEDMGMAVLTVLTVLVAEMSDVDDEEAEVVTGVSTSMLLLFLLFCGVSLLNKLFL